MIGMGETAAHVTAAEGALIFRVKAATIRQWAHRGRIVPVGATSWGAPLYRAADISALEKQWRQRAGRRRPSDPVGSGPVTVNEKRQATERTRS